MPACPLLKCLRMLQVAGSACNACPSVLFTIQTSFVSAAVLPGSLFGYTQPRCWSWVQQNLPLWRHLNLSPGWSHYESYAFTWCAAGCCAGALCGDAQAPRGAHLRHDATASWASRCTCITQPASHHAPGWTMAMISSLIKQPWHRYTSTSKCTGTTQPKLLLGFRRRLNYFVKGCIIGMPSTQ